MSVSQHIADVIRQDIVDAMKRSIGYNQDIAETLAADVLLKLQDKWGGSRVYIPAKTAKNRNELIKADFTGNNHADVCKKYDISLSTLYRVTK